MDALKALLVHADGGSRTEARLRYARLLAARHEARLRVQCSVNPVPCELAALHVQNARAALQRAEQAAGAPMLWQPPTEEQAIPAFCSQALHNDLLVLGQADWQDEQTSTLPRDFVEQVLLQSGRPAIVLPRSAAPDVPRTVLVAWKAGREAARALHASLALLQAAALVHVATWDNDPTRAAVELQEVSQWLGLHGIAQPTTHGCQPVDNDGEGILSLARALDVDLLVMGCYGHGRAREAVLGGATRAVLKDMDRPVLFTH